MTSHLKFELFECSNDKGGVFSGQRARVPGGWLVKGLYELTFVPDTGVDWVLPKTTTLAASSIEDHQTNEGTEIILYRSGEFEAEVTGEFHCGLGDGQFQYSVQLRCSSSHLDERGFLFEQQDIQHYFETKVKRIKESCEVLAIKFARQLVELVKKDNPRCTPREVLFYLSAYPFVAGVSARLVFDGKEKLTLGHPPSRD